MKKSILQNEQGFTLIEIIAVLIILGILSAVAVPKFMNLQADARRGQIQTFHRVWPVYIEKFRHRTYQRGSHLWGKRG